MDCLPLERLAARGCERVRLRSGAKNLNGAKRNLPEGDKPHGGRGCFTSV